MKAIGFDTFDWATFAGASFKFGIDPKNTFLNSVEPQLIPRPGTYPTFGVSQIGPMNIIGQFVYTPRLTDIYGGSIENAFRDLFKRLNPKLGTARQLRLQTNDGTNVTVLAVLSVPNYSTSPGVQVKDATFVCAVGAFDAISALTGGGSFS